MILYNVKRLNNGTYLSFGRA